MQEAAVSKVIKLAKTYFSIPVFLTHFSLTSLNTCANKKGLDQQV